MITVISLHSREGGTGKTSIGLSAAAQLAAAGHKVALIEFDSMGPHLGQCLPLTRVTVGTGEHLAFRCESPRSVPNLFWWLIGRGEVRQRDVLEAGDKLVLPPSCSASEDTKQLGTMIKNLTVFSASCFANDLDRVNQMLFARDTQQRFIRFISNLIVALEQDGQEFVFVDNSPGLSLLGAMMLSWCKIIRRTKERVRAQPWFVSTESSPHGLLVLEINVFEELQDPILIVNRAREQEWLGCPRGQSRAIGELAGAGDLFSLPLWLGAARPAEDLERDFLPRGMRVVALREDVSVSRAGELPAESPALDPASSWGLRVEEFFRRFVVPAAQASTIPSSSSFHTDVWSALVNPLG